MSRIYIINGASRTPVDTLITGAFRDGLDAGSSMTLTIYGDIALTVGGSTQIEYEGNYYDVIQSSHYMSGRNPAVDIVAEGVLYRLTDIEYIGHGSFSRAGTVEQLIGWVLGKVAIAGGTLSETPFYFGATDLPGGTHSVTFNYGIGEKHTRREMLQNIINRAGGGEIEIDGWNINAWSHRGNPTPVSLFDTYKVSSFGVSRDYREARETYNIELNRRDNIAVGDELHIVFDPLGVDVHTRVVALEYNPYNKREVSVEVGAREPGIENFLVPEIVYNNEGGGGGMSTLPPNGDNLPDTSDLLIKQLEEEG